MRGLDSTYLLQSPVEVTLSSLSQTHRSVYGSLWFNRGSPGLLTDAKHKHSRMRKPNFQTPTYTHKLYVGALTLLCIQRPKLHAAEKTVMLKVFLSQRLLFSVVCRDVANRERFENDECQLVDKRYKDESNMPCVITGRNLKNAVIWTEPDTMLRAWCS